MKMRVKESITEDLSIEGTVVSHSMTLLRGDTINVEKAEFRPGWFNQVEDAFATDCPMLTWSWHESWLEPIDDPHPCCAAKDATIQALADRCHGQSELLGKRAEKAFVGDPRFHAILKEMGDLHDERQQGYGTKDDPFANVRASEGWGIPPWQGAMIRGCDKIRRLQTFAQAGALNGERVEDAFLDLANYAVIALVLYREQKGKEGTVAA